MLLLYISCSAHPLNYSIGYKRIQNKPESAINLCIKRFTPLFYSNHKTVYPSGIYLDNLKKAIEVSLYNSGKFRKVSFENFSNNETVYEAELDIVASDSWGFGKYPFSKENQSFSLFFLPDSVSLPDEDGNRFFWPGIFMLYPAIGYFPLAPKSGRAEVILTLLIKTNHGDEKIEIKEFLPYSFMFYGVYRFQTVEELFPIVYSKALEKLTMEARDLNL